VYGNVACRAVRLFRKSQTLAIFRYFCDVFLFKGRHLKTPIDNQLMIDNHSLPFIHFDVENTPAIFSTTVSVHYFTGTAEEQFAPGYSFHGMKLKSD
jgi:hypothetical protein